MTRVTLPFLLLLAGTSCLAGTLSLAGNFDSLDLSYQFDPFLAEFRTSAVSDVTIQSYGYAGGANPHGQVIPPGGFDPIISVFRGTGPGAVFVDLDDRSGGACADSILQLSSLSAGTYTLAITPFEDYPLAWWDTVSYSTLGDGFLGLGSLGLRSADFAVDITSDALVIVPEPATVLLFGSAGFAIAILKTRSRRGR